MHKPTEETVLRHISTQLQGGTILHLTDLQREVLSEVMQASVGHTQGDVAEYLIERLEQCPDGPVELDSEAARNLRHELRALDAPQHALITLPEYRTRMSDSELCAFLLGQLEQTGTSFALPEIEMMQLAQIFEQTKKALQESGADTALIDSLCAQQRQLKRDDNFQSGEPFYRVTLPEDIAAQFRQELSTVSSDE